MSYCMFLAQLHLSKLLASNVWNQWLRRWNIGPISSNITYVGKMGAQRLWSIIETYDPSIGPARTADLDPEWAPRAFWLYTNFKPNGILSGYRCETWAEFFDLSVKAFLGAWPFSVHRLLQ